MECLKKIIQERDSDDNLRLLIIDILMRRVDEMPTLALETLRRLIMQSVHCITSESDFNCLLFFKIIDFALLLFLKRTSLPGFSSDQATKSGQLLQYLVDWGYSQVSSDGILADSALQINILQRLEDYTLLMNTEEPKVQGVVQNLIPAHHSPPAHQPDTATKPPSSLTRTEESKTQVERLKQLRILSKSKYKQLLILQLVSGHK
mmetsp:Transcript_10884/g.18209  ORF Transcript_10884/g.18209 Transcript_10884/m.18209 type:complete len:205 (+) Transcript_10884:54-668(+)